jgi:hypothetical protein
VRLCRSTPESEALAPKRLPGFLDQKKQAPILQNRRMKTVTLIAIEEHWIMPELTSALSAMPRQVRDESLAFNEMGDNRRRLEDLGASRIAAMDAQGID